MSLRRRGEPNRERPKALICYSTDTRDEARLLIVTVAKKQYDGRYVVVPFGGEVEDVSKLADKLDALYAHVQGNAIPLP